jgi:hypothetical protein
VSPDVAETEAPEAYAEWLAGDAVEDGDVTILDAPAEGESG